MPWRLGPSRGAVLRVCSEQISRRPGGMGFELLVRASSVPVTNLCSLAQEAPTHLGRLQKDDYQLALPREAVCRQLRDTPPGLRFSAAADADLAVDRVRVPCM